MITKFIVGACILLGPNQYKVVHVYKYDYLLKQNKKYVYVTKKLVDKQAHGCKR